MAKEYDLEKRTEEFAKDTILFCKKLPKNAINFEHISQVVRSSGSVGANYIEANESLGRKDFYLHIKISRKEAKESRYWFKLMIVANPDFNKDLEPLVQEATELMNIFGAILKKST